MGLVTWILVGVIVLVAIGLGVGVFFSGLVKGAQIVSQNPVVQNATSEAGKAIANDNTGVTVVHMQKTVYTRSEPVVIEIKNQGNSTVTFPEHSTILNIKDQSSSKTYVISATEDKTEIAPGDSYTVSWNQHDS